MIRRPPRSTQSRSSAASDVYKRQILWRMRGDTICAIHMQLTNIHEILEPLPINFQSQGPAILPSRKASPKYVKANQRWWLEVQFSSDIDLALFEKTIAGSPIRVIEFQNRFFIEDPRIPDVDDMRVGLGLVSRYAEDELPRLNAGVKVLCPQYVPARLRCIVYLDDKGQGHPITF